MHYYIMDYLNTQADELATQLTAKQGELDTLNEELGVIEFQLKGIQNESEYKIKFKEYQDKSVLIRDRINELDEIKHNQNRISKKISAYSLYNV